MKKIIFAIIFLSTYQSFGQYNQAAPWMDIVQKKSVNSKTTLSELSHSFELYWKGKDFQRKGSGFKPFKRWESHWSNYILEDGTIPPPVLMWKAWENKKTLSKSSISNWSSIGPFTTNIKTGQGRVNTFIIDPNNPNIYYVGAPAGGIWKSTDSGKNWTPLSDHLPQIGVSGIAIDPNNSDIIYIATGDDDAYDTYSVGVLKSIDGGRTWNTTGLNFSTTNSTSNEIYIHPSNSNIIWVATSKGFFKSSNGGNNWAKTGSGNVLDFKIKPGDPSVMYYVTADKLYKSTNGGDSFSASTLGLPSESSRFAIDVSIAKPEVVYLLSANNDDDGTFQGLYKSTDSGDSFQKTSQTEDIFESTQSWFDMALTISPTDANIVFVGVLDIWRSEDGGDSFTQINHWWNPTEESYTHADIHFLRFFDNKLYAGTDGGIYESKDNGSSFDDLTENLSISQYYKIATSRNSKSKVAGGLQDNGGFGYNNDQWNNYHDGDGMDCAIDPNQQDVYYGFSQFGASLNITYDGGVTIGGTVTSAPIDETDPGEGDLGGNWITPLVMSTDGILYAGYSKLYKLVNNEWQVITTDNIGGDIEQLAISPTNNEIIHASVGNELFKSVDGGISFTSMFSFPTKISSIEINNQNSETVYVSSGGYNGKIFKSIDGALNWNDITGNLPSEPKNVIKHQNQSLINDLYVGTSLGVYHINDELTEWEVFSTNLPNVPIEDIEINAEENTITVGTYGRGVWQSPISVTKVGTDLSLTRINSNNTIECGGASPVITIKNNGLNSINEVEIKYEIDEIPYTFNHTGVLESNESIEIELPFDETSSLGLHTLKIEAITPNDAFSTNNILYAVFSTNFSGEGQYVNTYGDTNEDDWLVSTEGDITDLWQKGTSTKFNGSFDNAYTTNLTGNYPDETTSYLVSPCYDLTHLQNPILKFDMAFDIEFEWDVLYMQYSLNNGKVWEILGASSDPNWYNSSFIDNERPVTVGKQWTGQETDVKEYSFDLSSLASENNIIFRFVFASDWAENGNGVTVDNFTIAASGIILSTDQAEEGQFHIFPNPASTELHIQRKSYDSMQILLYDITGKLVFTENEIQNSRYTVKLPNKIAKGLYIVKLIEGNKQLTKQLIIQ